MNDRALMQLGTARQALAECRTVMEAKGIADAAEAARVYLERTNASVETVNRATEIRLLAERQMGEFLKAMPKNVGVKGSVVSGSKQEPVRDKTPTLAEIGLTKKQSATAQRLAALPAQEFAERVAVAQAGFCLFSRSFGANQWQSATVATARDGMVFPSTAQLTHRMKLQCKTVRRCDGISGGLLRARARAPVRVCVYF